MFGQRREKKGVMVWIPVFQTVSQLSYLTVRIQQEDQFMDMGTKKTEGAFFLGRFHKLTQVPSWSRNWPSVTYSNKSKEIWCLTMKQA